MTNVAREKVVVYRINARLDARRAGKLNALARATGASVSDVIRDAIDHYHSSVAGGGSEGLRTLDKLVGCARGPRELSRNYKHLLTESLAVKHGNR